MKMVVNFNQKVPMNGVDFASIGAGVSIEKEVGEGKSDDEVRAFSRHLYGLARNIVEAELTQQSAPSPAPQVTQNGATNGNGASNGNGNGNGYNGNGRNGNGNGHRLVSEKQKNFIISLVAQKHGNGGLKALESRLGKSVGELTRKEASDLITEIKGG